MPSVLVLGATGYLGLTISQALIRSGSYTVHGTARSAEKARSLRLNEITPIQDPDILSPEVLAATITKHRFDIVIDASTAYKEAGDIISGVTLAAKQRAEAYANENAVGPKLAFIHTSGVWVHGSTQWQDAVSDLVVPGTSLHPAKPAAAVSWRPALEQAVLAARNDLDVAVLRPGAIYGRASWIFTDWWKPVFEASKNPSGSSVKIPAIGNAYAGIIHVDDVGEAYVAVANKIHGGLGSWPVFDVIAEFLPVMQMVGIVKRALGVGAPTEFVGTGGNPFLDAQSTVVNSDTSRARYVLGWEPKRRYFARDAKQFVMAWIEHSAGQN